MKTGYLHIDGNEARGRAAAKPHHWAVAVLAIIVAQWLVWQGSALGSAVGSVMLQPGILGMLGAVAHDGMLASSFIYLLVPFAAIFALSLHAMRTFDGRRANSLGLDGATLPLALVWTAAGLFATAPLIIATIFSAPPLNRVLEGVAVLTPVTIVQAGAEEVLFRGVILSILAARYGVRVGLVGSALLFGVWHIYFGQQWHDLAIMFLSTFLFGLTAGLVTLHFANLGPAIALHVVWNVASYIHAASAHGDNFWAGWVTSMSETWTLDAIASGDLARFLLLPQMLETLIVCAVCRETLNRLLRQAPETP